MTRETTISILLFFYSLAASGQKITFRQMDARQGLPAAEVYHLHQDERGYIWAFTEYGIVKHNGTRFIPVCRNLSFNESAVYKVARSPDKVIYIANSDAKIYRIEGDNAVLLPGMEKTSAAILSRNETILFMAADEKTIWFASHDDTYQYNLETHRVEPGCRHPKPGKELTFQTVGKTEIALKCIHPVNKQEDALFRLVDSHNRLVFSMPFIYTRYGRNGIVRNGDRYYIMAANTVMLAGPGGLIRKQQFDRAALSIRLAPDGHVWQGLAYGGLVELDADLNILHHYLPGVTVSDILFDNQGGMWVSTIGRGVLYCSGRGSTTYNDVPELSESITLLKVIEKQLFIGTASGELFVCRNKSLRKLQLVEKCIGMNDIIACKGGYFIAAKSGWFKANSQLSRVVYSSIEYGGYAFAEQKNKRMLLISAADIHEQLPGSDQFSHKLRTQRPRCITVRKEGTVFISTRKGLFVLNDSKLILPDYLKPLQGKAISRLCPDEKQNVWICTSGNGLYRLSADNQLIRYDGLPSDVITDICFLQRTNAVLCTNKGAFVASLNNGQFGAWQQLVDKEVVSAEEFDGKLYLGTKLGLTILEKEGLLKKPVYPFYLESVYVGRKRLPSAAIQLEHYQNHLYFNFDLLAYSSNEKQLIYELKGPSPGKGVVNGTQLQLQNLAPGHYHLRVYPANYAKNKQQKGWRTAFYIAPAWWQTTLFFVSVILFSILLVVLITWFLLFRIRRKAEVREQVTRLLAVYRLTALKAQINPHFISNSLAAIQDLVITDQTDRANQYLARFSLLIRYLLDYSDQSVASLTDELKIIDLIIELEQLRFDHQFVFRKEIAEDVILDDLVIPPLITQPFIENAIWHGLLPLKGKRVPELVLKIVLEEERLIISIIDNGVGRRGRQPNKREGHESKGTGLIQHRIENLNKLHTANGASILLTDLEDGNGEPSGTRVDIIFPTDMLNTLYDEQDQEHYY